MGRIAGTESRMNTASASSEKGSDTRKGASKASGDFEADLQALREEFSHLAEQVAAVLASSGNAAWRRAKPSIDQAVSGAEEKAQEAAEAVREVSGHFVDALDESIKTRPYATLALVAGLAFLFGATWRR